MKLKEYISRLVELEKEYGGDLDMVYASDDEGNSFSPVFFRPCVGSYHDDFTSIDDEDWERGYKKGTYKINSVCVN